MFSAARHGQWRNVSCSVRERPSGQQSHSFVPVKHHIPLGTEARPAPDSPHPGTTE